MEIVAPHRESVVLIDTIEIDVVCKRKNIKMLTKFYKTTAKAVLEQNKEHKRLSVVMHNI